MGQNVRPTLITDRFGLAQAACLVGGAPTLNDITIEVAPARFPSSHSLASLSGALIVAYRYTSAQSSGPAEVNELRPRREYPTHGHFKE